MKKLPFIFLLSLGLAFCPLAHADIFNVVVSGALTGSGTFTATDQGNGSFLVTDVNGADISGPLAVGAFNGNDNLIYPSPSSFLLDGSGVALIDEYQGNSYNVDFFENAGVFSAYYSSTDNGVTGTTPITISITPAAVTPEPATVFLLLTGLLGIVAVTRRRFLPAPIASWHTAV